MNKVENRAERFFQQMQGKHVAFLRYWRRNLPLIRIFAEKGRGGLGTGPPQLSGEAGCRAGGAGRSAGSGR